WPRTAKERPRRPRAPLGQARSTTPTSPNELGRRSRRRRCGVSLVGVRRHAPLPAEGHLPGFDGATGWLNSPPLTAEDLRGKVVLVDFWTYTCINWLRTLAYVRAWAETYEDRGLVVVGVHTPEFPFERD